MAHKKDVPHYGTQIGIMKNTVKDAFVVSIILQLIAWLLVYYHCGIWVYLPTTYSGIYLLISVAQYVQWKKVTNEIKNKTPAHA